MFGIDFDALANIGQIYLAICIGEMRFGPLDTCILVLALSAALLAAFNLWRITHIEARQRRLLDSLHRTPLPGTKSTRAPSRPPWYQQLGTTVAATRIIGAAGQKRLLASLLAAGVKGDGHLATLI